MQTHSRFRRTKIIITLGPSLDDPNVLESTLLAGVNVVRANFSHGTKEDHAKRIKAVRDIAEKHDLQIAVLADLQGPKIRIAKFKEGKIHLHPGSKFCLDADLPNDAGDEHQVGIDYKKLPQDVKAGDKLLLDDGRLVFNILKVEGARIFCQVEVGGVLSNNKGINRQGGGLSAEALTEKDKKDLKTAIELDVDYIAISFPRDAKDVELARRLVKEAKGEAGIVAKIERVEAVEHIAAIIEASDAIMIARGDLGVEIGDAELPCVQKSIIHECRAMNKPVITATQMMESMIENSIPTRAEVSDVANAVLDGTDAVMLSAETATGKHPKIVVEAMHRICIAAEQHPSAWMSKHRIECTFERTDEAIAMATMYTANHIDVAAIIALTESGRTPLWMSRIRSNIPIFGLSPHKKTLHKMALYRGVYPVSFDSRAIPRQEINHAAVEELKVRGIVFKQELVIITKGDKIGVHGMTNSMKIYQVE